MKHSQSWNKKISSALKGRKPWNKGLGKEDPRIRKMIRTRRINKALRELAKKAGESDSLL